jgi:hypothetical protein
MRQRCGRDRKEIWEKDGKEIKVIKGIRKG